MEREWLRRGLVVFLFYLLTISFDAFALLLPRPSAADSFDGGEVLWLQETLPSVPFDYLCLAFYVAGYPFLLYATAWVLSSDRLAFRRYFLVFSISQSLAILIWFLHPFAPPRLAVRGVRWVRGEMFGFSERFNTFPYGAFPSMHAAHGLVSLLFVWGEKEYRKWWVLVLICMVLSSLYLGEHYLVDVLGGFILGGSVFGLVSLVGGRVQS